MAGIPFQVLKPPETGILFPPYFFYKKMIASDFFLRTDLDDRVPGNISVGVYL